MTTLSRITPFAASIALSASLAHSQTFVINEVLPTPASGDPIVEIKNVTGSTQNLAGYSLCHKFLYYFVSGTLNVPASGFVRVHWDVAGANSMTDLFTGSSLLPLTPSADSVGLYKPGTLPPFGFVTPSNMADFVQWGAANQARVDVAVAAGEWPSLVAFVPAPSGGASVAFDGMGNGPSDWFRDAGPTPGAENFTPGAGTSVVGTGCGALAPALSATSVPANGNLDFRVDLTGANPSSTAILFVGLGTASLDLGAGCKLLVNPSPVLLQLVLGTNAAGAIALPAPIPETPSFAGLGVAIQFAVADGASPIGFDVSNGLLLQF